MKILLITPSLPYPPTWGFGIRVFNIAKELAQRHEVSLLTVAGNDRATDIAKLNQYIQAVYTVSEYHRFDRRVEQFLSTFSPQSFLQTSLYSKQLQQKVTELLNSERFDIIQVESSHLGGLVLESDAALILDEHNIEYLLLQRMYRTERSLARRLFSWLEYLKFQKEEQHFWSRADGVVFTSEQEERQFSQVLPNKPVICGPNGVDIDYFKPDDSMIDPNSIVMSGLMRYRPNIDAAVYMANVVLPLIHQTKPDVTFTIVGAAPNEEVLRLVGPRVIVTGSVPDVRPYVQAAAAVVVPLRMGSGTRLKVLEGLAMGKPMVSTSLGCEGIDVIAGEHLLIADEAQAFADSVVRLLNDSSLGQRLANAGRSMVVANYSWRTIVQRLEGFYEKIIKTTGEQV